MPSSSTVVTTTKSILKAQSTGWLDGLDDMNLPPEFLKYRAGVQETFANFATPLNITLFVVLLTVVYLRFVKSPDSSSATAAAIPRDQPVVFTTFTPRTLLKFNGTANPMNPDAKVYLAVKTKVHDVTAGRNFYGPGGPYENFAGRDATRGLACQSFDEEMLTKNLDGPLDPCDDLDKEQLENLQGWVERFDEKYLVVGKLKSYDPSKNFGS